MTRHEVHSKQKAKEAKMKEEEVAAKSRNIHVTILQWQ